MKTYKILDLFNVFGKKANYSIPYSNPNTNAKSVHEALDELYQGSGTVTVDELPEEGETGKIYYNTTDSTFYFFDGEEYKTLGNNGKIITDIKDVEWVPEFTITDGTTKNRRGFLLQPDNFYNLDGATPTESPYTGVTDSSWFNHEYAYNGEVNDYNEEGTEYVTNVLHIILEDYSDTDLHVWAGRFRAPADDTQIIIRRRAGFSGYILIDDSDNLTITAGNLYEFNIVAGVCMIKEIVE